jgi:hypothetical protein
MSDFPTIWLFILFGFVLVCAVVIVYALRNKGDVSARISHGHTSFELHAKERPKPKSLDR